MRIVSSHVASVAARFPKPLRFSTEPMITNTAVVVHLTEADGLVGFGYAPTFGFSTEALRSLIADDFAPRILATEVGDIDETISRLIGVATISGRVAGCARQALAILEMALLDIEAQLAGVPLHQLWGQPTDSVQAYASGGWRFLELAELIQFVSESVDRGFGAVKVQVGLSPAEDAGRLRAVRDAIGPDVSLMLDANQRIPSDSALDWVTALVPFRPLWLEEPLPADDHLGLAQLRRSSNLSLAAGESETEPSELLDLIAQQAVDVVQPDVFRVGLTATRSLRERANESAVVVAPHMGHEVSAQIMSGTRADGWLEYFDWFEDWWETPATPVSGRIAVSSVPGHGVRLRPGWLEAHSF